MPKPFKADPRSRDVVGSLATAPTAEPIAEPAPAGPVALVVWAKRMGFYGGSRIRPGYRFPLAKAEDFAESWMSKTGPEDARLVPLGGPRETRKVDIAAAASKATPDNPLGA